MAITEQSRHRLRTYLEETMGEERASEMMDHLLPVGWTDLATRTEVDALLAEIAHLRDVMAVRFDQMATKAEMERGFRRQTWALITATGVVDGLLLAALRFV